ncbi:MAG: phage holin family protein [Lachnospiraceae bacterium]|nr:phage holin family protein [Lachnospiraceae bacterium]MCM1232007.1 phage holin family protein [Ruminococcus flavefaciens]
MNPTIDLTQVIVALIGVLSAVITGFLIPFLKSKLNAQQQAELDKWVTVGVAAAEQLAKTGIIKKDERKKYVVDLLNAKGFTVDFDQIDKALNALIEATVYDLPNKLTNGEVKKLVEDQVTMIASAKLDQKVEEQLKKENT